MDAETARTALQRRAIVLELGGFRPPDEPLHSWFGRVSFARSGEEWPVSDDGPMHPLCQLNLGELPYRPPRLGDIDFISIFIGPKRLPNNDANGVNWCLRAYSSLDELVPLDPVDSGSSIRPFPMRPTIVERDYPNREDVDVELDEDVDEAYYDLFETAWGFKLGGWPSLVQSEIFWAPWNDHPARPEFVFQIDSTEKANWAWGDNGVGYFGRGTAPGFENTWTCEWQCY